jgi:hypothetical protein
MTLSPTRYLPFLCALAGAARADIFLTPPQGLNSGDTFRLIFLTGTWISGTSGDISTYDNFVTTSANAVTGSVNAAGATVSIINVQSLLEVLGASGVTWKAIVSTATVNAIDHIGTFNQPVFRLNGGRVANNSADLWDGGLLRSVLNDEYGHDHNYHTWTGTGTNGLATTNPLGTATPTYGESDGVGATWINLSTGAATGMRSVYGISSPITYAPVPEPGTWVLVVSAAVAILERARARGVQR